MTDNFDDEIPEVRFHATASRALLGLLCQPEDVHGGEWWLLVEAEEREPLAFVPVCPPYLLEPTAPKELAGEALRRAGYEVAALHSPELPWSAEWRIITPEDRRPRQR